MHIFICTYTIYPYTYTLKYIYTCIYTYIHIYMHIHVYTYICNNPYQDHTSLWVVSYSPQPMGTRWESPGLQWVVWVESVLRATANIADDRVLSGVDKALYWDDLMAPTQVLTYMRSMFFGLAGHIDSSWE